MNLASLIRKFRVLARECFKKRSLIRTLHNIHLLDKSFEGQGIDFGAKNGLSSYYQFLDLSSCHMTYTDIAANASGKGMAVDLETNFYVGSQNYDFALLMNVLEHIYNHKILLANIHKSLKSGGYLEGFVPFLYQYHADPDDYFRYTHSGLLKLLKDSGFTDIEITKIGVGMFITIASMSSRILIFRFLIFLWWLLAILLNSALSKVWKKNMQYYSGLAFTATKKN